MKMYKLSDESKIIDVIPADHRLVVRVDHVAFNYNTMGVSSDNSYSRYEHKVTIMFNEDGKPYHSCVKLFFKKDISKVRRMLKELYK